MAKQKQSIQKKTLNAADEVERSVRSIQAAFDKGDRETLRELMTEDHVSIMTYTHSSNAGELLKSLSDYNFSEYKISEQRVKLLTQEVALASHHATIKGTYKGKEVPSPVHVTTVWLKRRGKWLQAFYQETPVPKR
jgi:uncharacterized protein (TIGR02246 family)